MKKTTSSNKTIYYVITDVKKMNKRSTKIIEILGTAAEICSKHHCSDADVWAKKYAEQLNKEKADDTKKIIVGFSSTALPHLDEQHLFNGGYLFLQSLYYQCGMKQLCDSIQKKHPFKYDLNEILSNLVYSRILFPSSKLSTYECSQHFIEQPSFQLHHLYRSLDIIAEEFNTIQTHVYKHSQNIIQRDTSVLYYDCTNFFFEIEQEDGIRKYGVSKENRPNPLVEMGLYMDGSGIPLAIGIHPGNTNEQKTAIPLATTIHKEFECTKYVYCSDAGLGSKAIKKFHNTPNHAYVVTQSIKKLKGHLKEWALDPTGWKLPDSKIEIDLTEIDPSSNNKSIYYKERWINENGLEERLVVSYSPVYQNYLRTIRNNQINRAMKMVDKQSSTSKPRQNDPKRFIITEKITKDGEVAEEEIVTLNTTRIQEEEQVDGFYAVVTSLEDDIEEIIKINKGRWEIEESFRIMKTNMKSRPVFLQKDNRIEAHFLICFLGLFFYRILEKKLDSKYTTDELINTLKDMNYLKLDEGYIPTYKRTELTDKLHDIFNLPLPTEIIPLRRIKKIINSTKK